MKNALLYVSGAAALAFALTPQSPAQGEESDTLVLPHRFAGGTRALADEVNANFDAVADGVDGATKRVASAETRLDVVEVAQSEAQTQLDALETRVDGVDAAAAANSSAVADLQTTVAALPARPANTIVVAKENGDFDSVVAALESITDASPTNPYLVQVMPGVYLESDVAQVREGVHLRGSGPEASVIQVTRSDSFPTETGSAVRLFDGARITSIGVRNDGASLTSIGIIGFGLTRETVVDDVHVRVDGAGGSGHFGIRVADSDLVVRNSRLQAEGATIVDSAFACVDDGGPFSQPLIEDSHLEADDFAAQILSTAMTVRESVLEGDEGAISASIAGISRVEHCHLITTGLDPVYTTTGSASILSAASQFQGGNPFGVASSFFYVHCYKSNFQPISNGSGSAVQ